MIRRSRHSGSSNPHWILFALAESPGTNAPLFAYRSLLGYNGASAPSEPVIASSSISVRRESRRPLCERFLLAGVKNRFLFEFLGGPHGRIA
jgi:hypothetical protein